MIQLIHGDCYQEIKKIPDKSIDLIYIDPPYFYESGGASDASPVAQRIAKMNYNDLNDIREGFDLSILEALTRLQPNIYIYIYGVQQDSCFP